MLLWVVASLALTVNAGSAVAAIAVAQAGVRPHTPLSQTLLREVALTILCALHAALANASDTQLAHGAVGVERACSRLLRGLTLPEVAALIPGAIRIDLTFGGWQREASTRVTTLATGAVRICGAAAVGVRALEVGAGRRSGALRVRATKRAGVAPLGDTLEGVGAIRVAHADGRLAVVKVTALSGATIGVVDTLEVKDAAAVATACTGGTICVRVAASDQTALTANAGLASGTIRRAHARGGVDAGAAEEVADLRARTIRIGATPRRHHADIGVALAAHRAIGIDGALIGEADALPVVKAPRARRAIGVVLTGAGIARHTCVVLTDLIGRALCVTATLHRRGDTLAAGGVADLIHSAVIVSATHLHLRRADLTGADLSSGAIRVDGTLADELALEVQAALTGATLGVGLTPWLGRTDAELTDFIGAAVAVARALGGRDRQARPGDTAQTEATIRVGLAPVGDLTDVVDALRAGELAVIVALTGDRRCATTRRALPRRRAIRRAHT